MADMIGNTFVQLDTESLILQYLWTHEHTNSFTASQNQTKDFNFLLNETNRNKKPRKECEELPIILRLLTGVFFSEYGN